jgi:transposase
MIVLGADMHKGSHTIAAVAAATGELLGDKTVEVGARGFAAVLDWGRGLGTERVWALEDCRHVSGAFERFLLVRGERVVRVATRLMAGERRSGRDRGKSDRIDAIAVARAALREGFDRLPVAELAGIELDIRLLVDHRERLVRTRTALYNDLLWHLHDLWPEQTFPGKALLSKKWTSRIGRRLARAEQTARVRIARDEVRHLRELSHTIDALEAEIAQLVAQVAPQLLAEPGFGPLTAGKLIGEIAGAHRFATDAKLARAGGIAPIPVRSGKTNRHRLDRGGNRQIKPRSTASPSPAPAATQRPATTSPANAPKARAPAKRSAASNATSPGASGTSYASPSRPGPRHSQHQSLDIGAAEALARRCSSDTVTGVSRGMERDSARVAAAFDGCRSAVGADRAPADVWSSSNSSV